jgi:hypothetical protein
MRLFLLLLAISIGAVAQTEPRQETVLTFKGWPVVVFHPKQLDEFFPAGPVKICLEQESHPKCYTAPKDFGRDAKVESVSLDGESEAMLLSVASGGVSGFRIHLALLQPDESENLKNLLLSASTLSEQSQFRFLVEPEISPAKILVTATFDWGLNDAHHGAHRYFISTYVRQFYYDNQEWVYALADQYMTVKVYERESNENIIQAELKEIRSRLRRVAPKLARPQKK